MSRKVFLRIDNPRQASKNEFVCEVEREEGGLYPAGGSSEGKGWEARENVVHPVSCKYSSLVLPELQLGMDRSTNSTEGKLRR